METAASTYFNSSQWKRPDLNRRPHPHSQHKGGRYYSNHKRRLPLNKRRLQQPQGGGCRYTRGGYSNHK